MMKNSELDIKLWLIRSNYFNRVILFIVGIKLCDHSLKVFNGMLYGSVCPENIHFVPYLKGYEWERLKRLENLNVFHV